MTSESLLCPLPEHLQSVDAAIASALNTLSHAAAHVDAAKKPRDGQPAAALLEVAVEEICDAVDRLIAAQRAIARCA